MGRGWRRVGALRPFATTGRHCHKSSLQVPHLRADVGGGVLGPVPAPPQHRTSSTRPHRFARMVHAPPAPLRPAGTSWTGALGTHSYPRSRGSSMADATAGSSRAVARARPTAARRPRDVRVEMVIVAGQEEEEVAWLRRVGWVVRGRARARNPLPAMQRADPKRSGDACWPVGFARVLSAAVCAALVAKEGRPVSVGQGVAWSLCAALQAAEVRGAPWVTRGTGVTELRGASWPPQALLPSLPTTTHNPQPTTHTYFDGAVGGLGQAVRQQQRHGHGRGCC